MKRYEVWLHKSYPNDLFWTDYDPTLLSAAHAAEFKIFSKNRITEMAEEQATSQPRVDYSMVLREFLDEKGNKNEVALMKETSRHRGRMGRKAVWVLKKGQRIKINELAYRSLNVRFGRHELTEPDKTKSHIGFLEFEMVEDDAPEPEFINAGEFLNVDSVKKDIDKTAKEEDKDKAVSEPVPSKPTYICPACHEEVKSAIGLNSHVRNKHPEQYEEFRDTAWKEIKKSAPKSE